MRAIASPFPSVLEEQLASSLASLKTDDPLAPVLIIAPSILLLDRLKRSLSRKLGAVLGVQFLYHRSVAEEVARGREDPAAVPLTLAGSGLLERLLSGVIEQGDSPLRHYARSWPGALRSLLATFRDFRDAGVAPAMLARRTGGDKTENDLFSIYQDYVAALMRLEERGLTDGAGLIEAALPDAAQWARRYAHVFHHGAYDLIGVHAELMRRISVSTPFTWLVPADPEAPAFEMGRKFIAALGDGLDVAWPPAPSDLGAPALRATAMFGGVASFDAPMPPGALELFHTQGPDAEAEHAVRLALRAVTDEDIPPEEIAIVARDITTYAARLLPALEACGLSGRVHAIKPLSSEPGVQALIMLLRSLLDDFKRQPLTDLMRSPAFMGEAIAKERGLPFSPDLWDRWSRGAGVIRGRDMWTAGISGWLTKRREMRARFDGETDFGGEEKRFAGLACILDALDAARITWVGTPALWRDQALAIRDLASQFLQPFNGEPDGAVEQVFAILEDLARLDKIAETVPIEAASPGSAFAFLQAAISQASLRPAGHAPSGVRVIDLMQARCVPFERVILIGFNQGVIPRKLTEDPFLPDEARRRLRDLLGKPIPVKSEGEIEERILLALLVSGTGRRLTIGWQRADADGKTRSPSLALREIARIREGEPAIDLILRNPEAALRLKTHPGEALKQVMEQDGRLSPGQALIGAGLGLAGRGTEPGEAVRALRATLDRPNESALFGLALIARLEAWRGKDLTCDGIVGPEAAALLSSRLSVSALERLGRCPLSFFMRDILQVREMDTVSEEGGIEAWEMGELVHLLLEKTYARLTEESLFSAGKETLVARGLALVGELWDEVFQGPRSRIGRVLPLRWEIESSRWRSEVEAFLRADLGRLASEGGHPIALEKILAESIQIPRKGSNDELAITARLDRVIRYNDGSVRVGDYKTSGNPAKRVDLKSMLRGEELQIPLYVLAAERWLDAQGERSGGVDGEILALGPDIAAENRYTETGPRVADPKKFLKIRAGVQETLHVLIENARAGNFPMNPSRRCDYCPYRRGCRRSHPPSRARLEAEASLGDLRRARGKIQKKPMLADVSA